MKGYHIRYVGAYATIHLFVLAASEEEARERGYRQILPLQDIGLLPEDLEVKEHEPVLEGAES